MSWTVALVHLLRGSLVTCDKMRMLGTERSVIATQCSRMGHGLRWAKNVPVCGIVLWEAIFAVMWLIGALTVVQMDYFGNVNSWCDSGIGVTGGAVTRGRTSSIRLSVKLFRTCCTTIDPLCRSYTIMLIGRAGQYNCSIEAIVGCQWGLAHCNRRRVVGRSTASEIAMLLIRQTRRRARTRPDWTTHLAHIALWKIGSWSSPLINWERNVEIKQDLHPRWSVDDMWKFYARPALQFMQFILGWGLRCDEDQAKWDGFDRSPFVDK